MEKWQREHLRNRLLALRRALVNTKAELRPLGLAAGMLESAELDERFEVLAGFARQCGRRLLTEMHELEAAIDAVGEAALAADEACLAGSDEPLLKALDGVEHKLRLLMKGGRCDRDGTGKHKDVAGRRRGAFSSGAVPAAPGAA